MILLDMDGVLCDFISAALRVFNREDLLTTWPGGEYSIEKLAGITTSQLWSAIDEHGSTFWAELERYEWADDLVRLCMTFDVVKIASKPSASHYSTAGKVLWLQRNLGGRFADPMCYWFGGEKSDLARRGIILIDDHSKNTEAFRAKRGHAITFPQPWNDLHRFATRDPEKILSKLKVQLEDIYKELAAR